MDILAHALWTHAVHRGVIAKKKIETTRRAFWVAIFFGIAPDLFSFGLFFVSRLYQAIFHNEQFFRFSPPDGSAIPAYVFNSYNYTHSFLIFLASFALIWVIHKKPYWLMFGWGFHILIDIFSHSTSFFPTPFLFPISNFRVNGWSWGHPTFMIVNYSLILVTYLILYATKKKFRASN